MMSEGYSLPERLDPLPDESMAGLAMRYAALHGFATPERLFDRLALRRRPLPTLMALDPASAEAAEVETLLHLTRAQASAMSSWHPDLKFASVGGHRVFADLVDIHSRQCCPSCLVQAPYHRSFWLISAIPVCHVHGTYLLEACPRCDVPLSWRGLGPHQCANPDCCLDLREATPVAASPDAQLAAAGLHRVYAGKTHPSGMVLDDALLATLAVGRMLVGVRSAGRSRLSAFVRRNREEVAAVLAAGWAVLDPWPSAYHAFLAGQLEANRTEDVMPGLEAAFGGFHRLLRKRRGWQVRLGDELSRFALERTDVAVRSGRLIAQAAAEGAIVGDRMDLAEVGRTLGVSYNTASRIAASLGGRRSRSRRSGKFLVDAAAVATLARTQQGAGMMLTTGQAAELLGVDPLTLRRLVGDGCLAQVPVDHRVRVNESFRRADVQAILDAFERAAVGVPVVEQPATHHRRSRRGGSRDGFGIRVIVAGILAGTLVPVAVWPGGQGIGRFLFETPTP